MCGGGRGGIIPGGGIIPMKEKIKIIMKINDNVIITRRGHSKRGRWHHSRGRHHPRHWHDRGARTKPES